MGDTKILRKLIDRTKQIEYDFKVIREREKSPWVKHQRELDAQHKPPNYFTGKITTVKLERLVEESHAKVALLRYHQQSGLKQAVAVAKLREATERASGRVHNSLDRFHFYYEEDNPNVLRNLKAIWYGGQVWGT